MTPAMEKLKFPKGYRTAKYFLEDSVAKETQRYMLLLEQLKIHGMENGALEGVTVIAGWLNILILQLGFNKIYLFGTTTLAAGADLCTRASPCILIGQIGVG